MARVDDPRTGAVSDVVEAEVLGASPAGAPVIGQGPIGQGPIARPFAFQGAQTDEWILPTEPEPEVEQAVNAALVIFDEPVGVELAPSTGYDAARALAGPGPEFRRPGPDVLEADSWDLRPDDAANESYHGRRRAAAPWRRLWLVIAAAVVLLAGAVGIPLLLNSDRQPQAAGTAGGDDSLSAAGATTAGELGPPSSSPGVGASSSVKPSAARTTAPAVAASPKPSTTASPSGAPFGPLTMEGEAATLGGQAALYSPSCAPGVQLVYRIGKWGSGPVGTLSFTLTIPAAGKYAVTVHYLVRNDLSRNADIWTGPSTAQLVLAQTATFPNSESGSSPPGCIDQVTLTLNLAAGSNVIRFTNQSDRAPDVDKIVISKV